MNKLLTALILTTAAMTAQANENSGLWGWIKDHSCGGQWSCSDSKAVAVKTNNRPTVEDAMKWAEGASRNSIELEEERKAQIAEDAKFFKGVPENKEVEMSYNDCRAAIAGTPKKSVYHRMDLGIAYIESFYTDKYRVRMSCGRNKMIVEKELAGTNSTAINDFLK